MEMEENSDFNNTCRTCLQKTAILSVFNETKPYGIMIATMIEECTSLLVTQTDSLPKMICYQCNTLLQSSYNFRVQCISAERKFKQTLNKSETETEDKENNTFVNVDNFQIKLENSEWDGKDFQSSNSTIFTAKLPIPPTDDLSPLASTPVEKYASDPVQIKLIDENIKQSQAQVMNKCTICRKVFLSVHNLQKHVRLEHELTCTKCFEKFETEELLNEHANEHAEEVISCSECGQTFPTKYRLKKHKRNVHSEKLMQKCSICDETLMSRVSFQAHMRKHKNANSGETTSYKRKSKNCICPTCGKVFARTYDFKVHLTGHSGEKSHMCEICGNRFAHYKTLRIHLRLHCDQKDYKCPLCDQAYTRSDKLRDHLKRHTNEKTYQQYPPPFGAATTTSSLEHPPVKNSICPICGKLFSRTSDLNKHIKTHSGEKNYPCEVCGKRFARAHSLNYHLVTHSGEKKFKCSSCDKAFIRADKLRNHIRTHTEEKPYQCFKCDAKFTQRRVLYRHMGRHIEKKGGICSICNKTFTRTTDLKDHMVGHSGLKNYQCDVCNKRFAHAKTLKTHMKIHFGEMNHKCSVCDRAFLRKDKLREHMRTHTGEKPYECTICKRRFSQAYVLRNHMKTHSPKHEVPSSQEYDQIDNGNIKNLINDHINI